MKSGSFSEDLPNVLWRWLTGNSSCEVYVATALPLRALADRTVPCFFDGWNWEGLPRDSDRIRRVRKMYSLRQDASAVNLAKNRRSETKSVV